MSDSNDNAMRDYLIGILDADGPESAERRLALRDAWHQSQQTSDVRVPQPPAGAADRHAMWEQLIALADQSPAPGDAEQIAAWQNAPWSDVREAAQRLQDVRRDWKAIEASWPKELDVRLRGLFLRILSSPVTRTAQWREQLRRELVSSRMSRRAFRRFAASFRRQFPVFTAHDPELLPELLRTAKPVAAAPPRIPSGATKTEPSMGTVALILCGVVGGIVSGLTSSRDQVKPPPAPLKIKFLPQPTQPLPELWHSKYSLQEFLQRLSEQQRGNVVKGPFGSLEDDPGELVRMLFQSALDGLPDVEPADALQPANRAAAGDAP